MPPVAAISHMLEQGPCYTAASLSPRNTTINWEFTKGEVTVQSHHRSLKSGSVTPPRIRVRPCHHRAALPLEKERSMHCDQGHPQLQNLPVLHFPSWKLIVSGAWQCVSPPRSGSPRPVQYTGPSPCITLPSPCQPGKLMVFLPKPTLVIT